MSSEPNKQTLLNHLRAERANLEAAITALNEEQLTTPGVESDWSVKDVIAHLLFWEKRCLFYLKAARDGYVKEDDVWRADTVDALNARNYADQKNRPSLDVIDEERAVSQTLVRLIEATPPADLLEPDRFEWANGESLYDQIAGETYEHIRDHLEALRAWRKKNLGR